MTIYGAEKTLPLNGFTPRDIRNLEVVSSEIREWGDEERLYLELRSDKNPNNYPFNLYRKIYFGDFLSRLSVSDPKSLEGRVFAGFFYGASLIGICPSEDLGS